VKYSRKKTIGIKLVKNNDKKLNFEKKCITCGKNGVLCKDQCQKCYQKEANKNTNLSMQIYVKNAKLM
jgi:predicted nucleic acid-binding Zn ribbon protein